MSDIVARLRVINHHTKKLAENESLHDLHRDYSCICNEMRRMMEERDAARLQTVRILNEIDCRIEHGAESNGHLEAIYNLFKENSNV